MGRRVDARTDVWAFGCVLFEMLTGQRVFDASSVRSVLTQIVEREPDLSRLPAGTPEPLRRLIRRCLQKDPRKRLSYIGDALLDLDEVTGTGDANSPDGAAVRGTLHPAVTRVTPLRVVAVVVAALAGVAGVTAWLTRPAAAPQRTPRRGTAAVAGTRPPSARPVRGDRR